MSDSTTPSVGKNYAIMRVERIREFGEMRRVEQHNTREKLSENVEAGGPEPRELLAAGPPNVLDRARERTAELGLDLADVQGAVGVEVILTTSHAWWVTATEEMKQGWMSANLGWLDGKFGQALLSAKLHEDEKTPHIHAVALAAVCKVDGVRGPKPKTEEGRARRQEEQAKRKPRWRWNYRDLFGQDFDHLSLEQDRYHAAVAHLGLERGERGQAVMDVEMDNGVVVPAARLLRGKRRDGTDRPRRRITTKQYQAESREDRAKAADLLIAAEQDRQDADAARKRAEALELEATASAAEAVSQQAEAERLTVAAADDRLAAAACRAEADEDRAAAAKSRAAADAASARASRDRDDAAVLRQRADDDGKLAALHLEHMLQNQEEATSERDAARELNAAAARDRAAAEADRAAAALERSTAETKRVDLEDLTAEMNKARERATRDAADAAARLREAQMKVDVAEQERQALAAERQKLENDRALESQQVELLVAATEENSELGLTIRDGVPAMNNAAMSAEQLATHTRPRSPAIAAIARALAKALDRLRMITARVIEREQIVTSREERALAREQAFETQRKEKLDDLERREAEASRSSAEAQHAHAAAAETKRKADAMAALHGKWAIAMGELSDKPGCFDLDQTGKIVVKPDQRDAVSPRVVALLAGEQPVWAQRIAGHQLDMMERDNEREAQADTLTHELGELIVRAGSVLTPMQQEVVDEAVALVWRRGIDPNDRGR